VTETHKILLSLVLAAVAAFGVPAQPETKPAPTPVVIPSAEMQTAVADVHKVMSRASVVDRALWAEVWAKAAKTVNGDATDTEVVFSDTRSLRLFNVVALRIAWRRLGDNAAGKYPGLSEATEKAFAGVLGLDVRPVTPELRRQYVELCNALSWCGAGKG
jgi:hypothetical protein